MKRLSVYIVGMLAAVIVVMSGCDIAINPLILSGTPVSTVIEIDEISASYEGTEQIDLGDLLEAIDEAVDSISAFNITLSIERLAGTPEDLTASGSIQLNNLDLATLTNLPLSMYATERSLFDGSLTQYLNVNSSVVAYLNSLLTQSPLPTITIGVNGEASGTPIRLRFVVTVYTQVYTTP